MLTVEVPQVAVRMCQAAATAAYRKTFTRDTPYLAECAYSNVLCDSIKEWKTDTLDDRIGAL